MATAHSWDEVADGGYIRNHEPNGDTLYNLELMIDPEYERLQPRSAVLRNSQGVLRLLITSGE